MAKFEIDIGGQRYEIEAPNEEALPAVIQQLQGQSEAQPSSGGVVDTLKDVAASGASGVARGAADLVGLPGTLSDLGKSGMDWLLRSGYEAVTGNEPEQGSFFAGLSGLPEDLRAQTRSPVSGPQARSGLSAVTGGASEYKPETTAGEFASTVGEFVPGAVAFGGASPSNIARFAVAPGLASEAAGQATEGSPYEPYARIAAALAAPVAVSAAQRLVTPIGVSAERAAAADILRSEGVRPTAGQVTGNKGLRYRESELGGARAADMVEETGEQFTKAALKRAGIDADRATPDVMAKGLKSIGDKFDDLAARNNVTPDQQFLTDLRADRASYIESVGSGAQAPIVENVITDIIGDIQKAGGVLKGTDYKKFATRIRDAERTTSSRELKSALGNLRETLDEAMERSLSSIGSDDMALWREARREYRNYLTLERAVGGAGEDAALGLISPARLRQAAITTQGRRNYNTGKSDFDALARSGEALLKPLPNSGTAPRINAQQLIPYLAGAGGIGGTLAAGPLAGAAGLLAGMAAPAVAGRTLMSAPVQSYLANQLLSPSRLSDPRLAAVVEALIGQQAAAQDRAGRLQAP